MNLNRSVSIAALAVLCFGGSLAAVNAQTFGTLNNFDVTNTNGVLTLTSTGATTFTFDEGTFNGQTLPVTVSLTATDSNASYPNAPSHDLVFADVKLTTFAVTLNTAVMGKTNALTISGAGTAASAFVGDNTAQLVTIDINSGLTLTSDFDTFSGANDLTISFPATTFVANTGKVGDFTTTGGVATATITSLASASVPEPGMVSLIAGLAVAGSGFGLRRRRRAA